MARNSRKPLGMVLGRNIAALRKAHGMTQSELAEALGVEPLTVSRFERGVNLPTLPRLEQIADLLGASVGAMVSESSTLETDQTLTLRGWLDGLSYEDRRLVIDLVKPICERLRKR